MQAGLYRLKHLGITETHPSSISSAMGRLPDEAIALAAASHIERELQITPWNLSSNFVASTQVKYRVDSVITFRLQLDACLQISLDLLY